MIGLTNQDSSFFEIETVVESEVLTEDILSFSITEEISQMATGNLQLVDNNDIYTKLLRPGVKFEMRWGYRRIDDPIAAVFAQLSNPTEVFGLMERRGLVGYVTNPSGSGDDKGNVTFNCSFIGAEVLTGGGQTVWGFPLTRGAVVLAVMVKMGIKLPLIMFGRMLEVLDANTALIQIESNYKFLLRLAREWNAIFTIGNSNGQLVGLFAEWNTPYTEAFGNIIGASLGTSALLEYKYGNANVKSYTWKNNAGQVAGGANVQIVVINGQVSIKQYVAATQSVVTYRIDSDKIFSEMKSRPSIGSQVKLLSDWMAINDFQTLIDKRYFYPVIDETAPQGYGYELSVKLLGNPLITAPMKVKFGKGFPSFSNQLNSNFWVRSATHTIDRSGYYLDLDVVDALSAFGRVA
jgi:hypothetical protein